MKKIFFLTLLIVALPNFIYAENKSLHVGISTGYPPFYFFDDNQKPVGLCIEVIHHVARQLNISVQFSSYPWNRMIYNGKEGYVDAIMPLFKTSEREQFLIFPKNDLIKETNSFFTLKSNTLNFSGSLTDIAEHHIGAIENYSYGDVFDKIKWQHKTMVESEDQLIQLVLNKRVEMGLGNIMVITYLANKKNISDKIKFLSPHLLESPLHIGFSKKNIPLEFVTSFDKSLQRFKSTKDYADIVKKYNKQY